MAGGGRLRPGELRGRVVDETRGFLPGVVVELKLDDGVTRTVYSDSNGEYIFPALPSGSHHLRAWLMNFAEVHRTVAVNAGSTHVDIILRPTLAAYVMVTAPRTFRNLAEVTRPEESALNSRASDIDYFYISRLRGEPSEGVADIHTHPMPPRTLRVALGLAF